MFYKFKFSTLTYVTSWLERRYVHAKRYTKACKLPLKICHHLLTHTQSICSAFMWFLYIYFLFMVYWSDAHLIVTLGFILILQCHIRIWMQTFKFSDDETCPLISTQGRERFSFPDHFSTSPFSLYKIQCGHLEIIAHSLFKSVRLLWLPKTTSINIQLYILIPDFALHQMI